MTTGDSFLSQDVKVTFVLVHSQLEKRVSVAFHKYKICEIFLNSA